MRRNKNNRNNNNNQNPFYWHHHMENDARVRGGQENRNPVVAGGGSQGPQGGQPVGGEPPGDGPRPAQNEVAIPPIQRRLDRTVKQNLDSFKIDITQDQEELFKTLKIRYEVKDFIDAHPHPISAARRKIITAEAIELIHRGGARIFTSIYGNRRDKSITTFLNRGVPEASKIHCKLYRELIAPYDITRGVSDVDFVLGEALLLVDIYCVERAFDVSQNFSPLAAYTMMRTFGIAEKQEKKFFWIGHLFDGVCGDLEMEGGWIRKNGRIICRPDIQSKSYADHDPCDWLWMKQSAEIQDGGLKYVYWVIRKNQGSFSMVEFFWSSTPLYTGTSIAYQRTNFRDEECQYYMPGEMISPYISNDIATKLLNFAGYGQSWLGKRTLEIFGFKKAHVWLPPDFLVNCVNTVTPRHRTAIAETGLMLQVANYVNKNKQVKLLSQLFENEFRDYLPRVQFHVLSSHYLSRSLSYRSAAGRTLSDWSAVTDTSHELVSSAPEPPALHSFVKTVLRYAALIGCGSFLCYQIYKKGLGETVASAIRNRGQFSFPLQIAPMLSSPTMFFISVFTPIVEEIVKSTHWGFFLPEVELGLHMVNWWNTGVLSNCWPAYIMHRLFSDCDYITRVVVHSVFNTSAMLLNNAYFDRQKPKTEVAPGTLLNPWLKFVKYYYESFWEERILLDSDQSISSFSPLEGRIMASQTSCCTYSLPDQNLDVKDNLDRLYQKPSEIYTYYILPTSMPQYRPANTVDNLVAVCYGRLVTENIISPNEQKTRWLQILPSLPKIPEHVPISWDSHLESWIQRFPGSKQKRYRNAALQYTCDPGLLAKKMKSIRIMVKTDEVLMRCKDNQMQLKPRPIANVHPIVQTFLGPQIFEAQERVKNYWNINPVPYEFDTCRQWITFACGLSDFELSSWAEYALQRKHPGDVSILVSGDDSLVIAFFDDHFRFLEGDASMFDQTQSDGPLIAEHMVLQQVGLSTVCTSMMMSLAHSNYLLLSKDVEGRIVIGRQERAMRDTGGADTTVGNSINMALAWSYCLRQDKSIGTLEQDFAFLGFQMKLKEFEDLTECSFLKGAWYPTTSGYWWGPLPSRILKVGKSFKDPCDLYKKKDRRLASTLFLNDVATGLRPFLLPPILRTFVHQFAAPRVICPDLSYQHVTASGHPLPELLTDQVDDMLTKRYGQSWDHYRWIEQTFPESPFHFLEDPLFIAMGLRDYN